MGSGMGGNTMSSGSHSESVGENSARSAMIVIRGRCTFAQKALVAQALGASAVVIHCDDISRLSLPYQSYNPNNNNILSGNTDYNLCVKNNSNFASTFSSQHCLLTGKDKNACCAWDLHVWLYSNPFISHEVTIPVIFTTFMMVSA
mmetsp:Transcript_6781/g.9911  ORF Transcript_6781/g.9911 Transcript_6781/m.9911 type:complete len:146 (-) Transcript_6781:200-637(-)